jgi:hypothetical protein
MEEEVLNPITPQEFSSKIKDKYPQYKDIDDVSLAKKMVEKYPEYSGQVDFGLKKKEEPKSTYRKNLLELASKPKKQSTLLGTEPQKKTSESESLNGTTKSRFGKVAPSKPAPVGMKKLNGKLSSDDLSKMKATNKTEANVIQQPSENPRDGFLDYLSDTAEVGILSSEKFLADTPEMMYDLYSKASILPSGQIEGAIAEATGVTPFKRMQQQLGFENIPSNILKEKIDGLNQRIQVKSQDYGGDPLSAIEQGRYSDAAKLIAGSTLQSAPMMAIAIATGGGVVGLATIGVMTASGKYQENLQNKELSQNQRLSNAAASGVLESTLGHFFSGASGAVAKRILKDKGVEAGSKILSNSFRRFAEKNIMKSPVIGFFGEVLEETAVDGGEQANDIIAGIRKEFDGRSAINSGLSSLGLGSTNTVSVYGAKAYISSKKYVQIKKTNKAIARLQNEINNEGISEESKKIFQIKSQELIANNKRALGEEIEKLKTLSPEDKALLKRTNSVIDEVSISMDNIKEDKTLSPEAKRIATAEIYKDYVEAAKVKRGILSKLKDVKVEGDFTDFTGVPLDFDIETSGVGSLPINKQSELNKKALEELNAELNPTGMEQVDITKDMVSERASKLYDKEIESAQTIQEEVTPVEEPINNDVKVEELRSQEQTELKEALPNAEVNTEGKVDKEKLSTEDQVVFDDIYNKYDKLISPLLDNTKSDYKAIAQQVLDKTQLNTVRASLRASSPDSFTLEVLDAIAKGESVDFGDDSLNQAIDDAIQNGVSINTVANLIMEDDGLSDNKGIDSKRKAIDYALNIGGKGTILKAAQEAVSNNKVEQQPIDNSTQTLTETDLPGYDRMMSETDGIVEKSKKRRVNIAKIADNVMSYVTGSKVYEDATDVQREALVRDVRNRFGIKEKVAPSANRILGNIKDVKKITISEKTALKKQITDKAKAAKDAVKAQKEIAQQIAKDVKDMAISGAITDKQAANLVVAFSKTNVFDEDSVDKFTTYATKVFENAEYQDKIDNANKLISSVKKKLRSKDIDPDLKDLAKKLVSIKPSKIEDVDKYIQVIDNVDKNIKGSTFRGGKLNISEGIDKAVLSEYIDKEIEKSKSLELQDIMNSFYDNTGLNPSDFSYEEIQEMIYQESEDSDKFKDYDRLNLNSKLKEASFKMKSIVNDMIQNRINSFSFDRLIIDDKDKARFKELMDINIEDLSKQDSLLYIDILNDIIVNGDSNRLDLFNKKAEVIRNVNEFSKSNKAKKLKLFLSPVLGRLRNRNVSSLGLLTEDLMKSQVLGNELLDVAGVLDVNKGKNKAIREVDSFYVDVVDKFGKNKPNGKSFTDIFNDHERGMFARLLMSTEEDFLDVKNLIGQSISNLEKGDSNQKEIAKSHREVYDKILKDSESIEDVKSKTDDVNISTVNYFIEKYKNGFDEKNEISKSIYNSGLKNIENYTPITMKFLKNNSDIENDFDDLGDVKKNTSKKVYDKKSGTFIERTNTKTLPKDSFISFDFLLDNNRKMRTSLVDTYTAKEIQGVKTFLESNGLKNIIEDREDRDLFSDRVRKYVKRVREREFDESSNEVKKISKALNELSKLGTARALGGIQQAISQTIPVASNTLINSGRFDLIDAFNSDWNKLIDSSSYDIANRGIESQGEFSNLESVLKQSRSGFINKASDVLIDSYSKAQAFNLKIFLAKPDIFIARASFISYYKKYMLEQGESIDPKNHVLNEKAARYAENQVNRQQNLSDSYMEGDWLADKNSSSKIVRSMLIPFAKFQLNQKMRQYNDFRQLLSTSNTVKDKSIALRSLASLSLEVTVFTLIKEQIGDLLNKATEYYMGYEETEEEKKKSDREKENSRYLSFTSSFVSPLPFMDGIIQEGAEFAIDKAEEYYDIPKEDRIPFDPYRQTTLSYFGTIGAGFTGTSQILEYESLMNSDGSFKDSRGQKMKLLDEDIEKLKNARIFFYLNQAGIAPKEVEKVIKRMIKISKKRAVIEGIDKKPTNRF